MRGSPARHRRIPGARAARIVSSLPTACPHHGHSSRRRFVSAEHSYDYAIIRLVPRVERGELINVGVILSCPAVDFLEARVELDEERLRALDSGLDVDDVRAH